jgi:hypothetical protein
MTLVNDTITANLGQVGEGLYAASSDTGQTVVTVLNEILWGNRAEDGRDVFLVGGNTRVDASHSDVGDVVTDGADPGVFTPVENPADVDPVFVNPALGNYRLNSDSPVRGAGSAAGAPDEDFEGDARGP